MSGSVGSTTTTGTSATGSGSGTGASGSGSGALGSLTSNFSSFLQLLMTQLQNQDPTSPLDTNQFTTELVQFSSVEQQIATNTNLKQLIQLSQAGEVIQSATMLGHKVSAQSDMLSLQSGSASVRFTAPAAGGAAVVVTDSRGAQLYADRITTVAGQNSWTWNGHDLAGNTVADGAYRVTVTPDGAGATPFTLDVVGTVSAVNQQGSGVQVQLGALPISFSAIRAVLN